MRRVFVAWTAVIVLLVASYGTARSGIALHGRAPATAAAKPNDASAEQASKSAPEANDSDEPDDADDAVDAEKKSEDGDKESSDAKESASSAEEQSESEKDEKSERTGKEKSAAKADEKPEASKQSAKKETGEKKETAEKKGAAADKKKKAAPAKKKPATYKVKTKDLKIDVEADGVFVADEAEEVALRPEVWSSFKVVKAVPHGSRVRKGDVLIEFDDRDIDKAIAEKSLDQRLGEIALMEAEEDFPRVEKSVELEFASAQRDYDDVVEEYARFKKTMRALSEKYSAYNLKSTEQFLDNAEEELKQLEKMYKADELTEETEEIVLRRQRFEVEVAKFYLEYSKINHEYTMDVSIPQHEDELQRAVDKAKLELQRAKTAKTLGLTEKRYTLEALRERRALSVENHAKLLADRALMTLKAPRDGVAYYGRAVNDRWGEVSNYESKLIPFGTVSPNSVLITVISDRSRSVHAIVGEKAVADLKEGQKAIMTPAADSELDLDGKVKRVDAFPKGGNQFDVDVALGETDLPQWLKPGMTCKTKITVYEASDVVVIPEDLVQSDEDEPKSKYVMLHVDEEEKPVRRNLKLGKHKDKEVEVLKGLEAGDLIVKGAKDDAGADDEDDD